MSADVRVAAVALNQSSYLAVTEKAVVLARNDHVKHLLYERRKRKSKTFDDKPTDAIERCQQKRTRERRSNEQLTIGSNK